MVEGQWWLVTLLLLCEKEFLVVGELDNAWNVENFLQVGCKDEGDEMAKMECGGRGAATCVEIELFAGFVVVEKGLEIAVGEEDAASEEEMGPLTSEVLETSEELGGDGTRTELGN